MTTDLTSLFLLRSFLFSSAFVLLLAFKISFSLPTHICSPVTVFWTLFFCSFYFSVVSGVGKRFVSDDAADDDDDGDEDDDDDDGDDDDNDDDDDDDYDKDDDNVDGDEENDDDDDHEWLFFCNSNVSLHLANWFNNELIISSIDFNCFRRKYTSSSIWAVNVLEPSVGESTTFSNESNILSLNDLISAKKVLCSNRPANVSVSVKQVEVVERS